MSRASYTHADKGTGDLAIACDAATRAWRALSPAMREVLLLTRETRWGPLVWFYDVKRAASANGCVRRGLLLGLHSEAVPGVCYPVTPWGLMVREAGTRTGQNHG
jgi:hypothetical protein